MTEEQINHLQSLLDAGPQGKLRAMVRNPGDDYLILQDRVEGARLFADVEHVDHMEAVMNLYNIAPALLEAARENLRLREALELMIRGVSESRIEKAKAALGKETV